MQHFDVPGLLATLRASDRAYLEFLRVPDLSVGLYRIPAGGEDLQRPHREDEVYHVLRGSAAIRVGGDEREVGPGSVVYVKARVEHRFVRIREDLEVLVFFAPAESGPAGDP